MKAQANPSASWLIDVENRRFVKSQIAEFPDALAKSRSFVDCAVDRSWSTPALLASDQRTQRLEFELIRGLVSIREYYLRSARGESLEKTCALMHRVGHALADIHGRLEVPRWSNWQPAASYRRGFERELGAGFLQMAEGLPQAALHGDFGFSNVNVVCRNDRWDLVIIDPLANNFSCPMHLVRGPIYLDIGSFLACLQGLVPLRKSVTVVPRFVGKMQCAFLDGYAGRAGLVLNRSLAWSFARAYAASYLQYRLKSDLQGRIAMAVLFRYKEVPT